MVKHELIISAKEIYIMKYTVIFTILALSLFMLNTTVAAPILIEEEPIPSSLIKSDSISEEESKPFTPEDKESQPPLSEDGTGNTVDKPRLALRDSKSKIREGFIDDSYNKTIINNKDINQRPTLEVFENKSTLINYDFASYQQSLNELINGTQIIPMQLVIWKSNLDDLVYSSSEIEPLKYDVEGFNNGTKNRKKTNKKQYRPSDWDVFLNSIYFTWLKVIFIMTVLIIIFRDFIRVRRLKKTRTSRVSRTSRSRYRRK